MCFFLIIQSSYKDREDWPGFNELFALLGSQNEFSFDPRMKRIIHVMYVYYIWIISIKTEYVNITELVIDFVVLYEIY